MKQCPHRCGAMMVHQIGHCDSRSVIVTVNHMTKWHENILPGLYGLKVQMSQDSEMFMGHKSLLGISEQMAGDV